MKDRQFEVGEILDGRFEWQASRLTRRTDPTAHSLFGAMIASPYQESFPPYATAFQTSSVLVAIRETGLMPDLASNRVDFSGRITAAIPAARGVLGFGNRTTYLLEDFRITSAETVSEPPEVFTEAFKRFMHRIQLWALRRYSPNR